MQVTEELCCLCRRQESCFGWGCPGHICSACTEGLGLEAQ